MKRRTPAEACIEYAIATESVREQTRIMRDNRCTEESGGELDFESGYSNGAQESCMSRHWNVVTGPAPNYREYPEIAYEDMCDGCKVRLKAFEDRREARKRLGAAKRAVEAIGKREIAAAATDPLEALKALRSFMWSEGYADQTAEMAQADKAIAKAEAR